MRDLNLRLQGIRNEIDGWEGFGKGLALVFSLGIYNPIEENRNKVRQEIAVTNAQAASARLTWSMVQAHQAELQACSTTLDRLSGLEDRVAALAQDVAEGLRQTADAVQEAETAQTRRRPAGSDLCKTGRPADRQDRRMGRKVRTLRMTPSHSPHRR